MAQNQFEVFGVDVRDYGRLWLAGWKDFLFGDDSPTKKMLDAVVALKHHDGCIEYFQGGSRVVEQPSSSTVLALPPDLVLERNLQLPTSIEADLEAALSMEVAASSPFAPDDTAAGWRVTRTSTDDYLSIQLVVASKRAVEQFLADKHAVYDHALAEVWAPAGNNWVALRGFGESVREAEYTKRLVIVGSMLTGVLLLVLCLAGLSALLAQSSLAKLEALQVDVRGSAAEAMKLRDRLANANATIQELNTLSRQLPSPQLELARLTTLLPDSAYLVQYTQNGQKIRLRGRSTEAAPLQQALTEESVFRSVTSPQAISRVGDSNVEQFFLDLELKGSR
jgi:general secretion pathway protein L